VLKKTVKYKDFNDEEVSEDLFFHLTQAELVELELSHDGGLSEGLKRIIAAEDGKAIIAEFKNIILGAYGQRSADGRRFIKNKQLRDEFESSAAYSELFMELVTNTDSAVEFVNGIIPSGMSLEAARQAGIEAKVTPIIAVTEQPRVVTKSDITEMSLEDIQKLQKDVSSGRAELTE